MRIVTTLTAVVLGTGIAFAAPCPSADLAALRTTLEAACPCADAASGGAYVKCVKAKLKADGVKGGCKGAATKAAAQSVCGKPGSVVCCTPGKKGKVVKSATKCKKGTACPGIGGTAFSVFPLSGIDCSAAGACPTTTTSTAPPTTTSTTTTPTTTSTTTTTEPNLCVGGFPNGTVETGEECDDDNVNPTDGCTAACTTCGNGVVTAPETCDDSNLTSGDGCDANCKTTGCGNGLVVAPETCDDGNTSNDDSCPSDCIVDACTPQAASNVAVDVNVTGTGVGALTILLDYPEGKVSIPGSGGSIPNGILTDYQDGSTPTPNDLDHALRNVILGPLGSDLAAGRLFRIHFESCAGAGAITSGDFACTIVAAANALGDPIPTTGLACSVAIP